MKDAHYQRLVQALIDFYKYKRSEAVRIANAVWREIG